MNGILGSNLFDIGTKKPKYQVENRKIKVTSMSEASLIILSSHFRRHRLLNMPNLNPWLPHRNFISTLKMDLLLNSDGSLVCKSLIFKYCKISASTHLIT
jgi:hypothetical protein